MPIDEGAQAEHLERRRQSPETLRLRAVMPLFQVADLERSLAWYTQIMGFVVSEELHRDGVLAAARLKAGKVQFVLEQDSELDGPRGQGVRLYCATRQDVNRLAATIQERGGTVEQAPDDAHGGRDFTIVDPDGYRISVFWRPGS
jgi:predicted enzyme related to lactoylglutathione lyase